MLNRYYCKEAREILQNALEENPSDWRLHRLYIQSYGTWERVHEVLPYYVEMMEKEPENPIGFAGAAVCGALQRSQPNTEENANRAIELAPESLSALDALLMVKLCWWNRDNDEKEVTQAFNHLIEEYPDYSIAYFNYMKWLCSKQNYRDKISEVLEKARNRPSIDPDIEIYQIWLNDQDQWRDPKDNIPLYEDILKRDPSLVRIKERLARTYADLGEIEKEKQLYLEITEEAPRWAEGWSGLSKYYHKVHEYELANQALDKLLKVPEQDYIKLMVKSRIAENLYFSGDFKGALAFLQDSLNSDENQIWGKWYIGNLHSALLVRGPSDQVHIIDNVPFLKQKGYYCDPASLSMLFGYWGVKKTQDEIADKIFTVNFGSSPQTTAAYCQTEGFECRFFQGGENVWKKLLDQNIPILWLKFSEIWGGGHYVVVTGYDDILKRFIIHNPHVADESEIDYNDIEDDWGLNLQMSLIVIPRDRLPEFDVSFLETPLKLKIVNQILHYGTGANLSGGMSISVLGNLIPTLLLLGFTGWILHRTTFPRPKQVLRYFWVIQILFLLVDYILISQFRVSNAVSSLIFYHIALVLFSFLIFIYSLLYLLLRWHLTAIELSGVGITVLLSLVSSAFIDDYNSKISTAFLVFAICFLICFSLRLWVLWRSRMKKRGDYSKILMVCQHWGSSRGKDRGLFVARMREIFLQRRRRQRQEVNRLCRELLACPAIARYHVHRLKLLVFESLIFEKEENSNKSNVQPEWHQKSLTISKGSRFVKACHYSLQAKAAILTEDWAEAKQATEAAGNLFWNNGLISRFSAFMEWLRGNKEMFRSYQFLHTLNTLEIVTQTNDSISAKKIIDGLKDRIDLDFCRDLQLSSYLDEDKMGDCP